jgi:hypothetical protein
MVLIRYGMVRFMVPPQPPVSVFRSLRVVPVASFSTCLTPSLRQAGQSALVRGWVCLCGRWKLYELMRAHTAKVIGLEMRRTCNTDASRVTGWTASMSSPYVGLPSGLCPGTRPRARACRLVLDSELGAAAVWCTLPVHLVDQRAIVDQRGRR